MDHAVYLRIRSKPLTAEMSVKTKRIYTQKSTARRTRRYINFLIFMIAETPPSSAARVCFYFDQMEYRIWNLESGI